MILSGVFRGPDSNLSQWVSPAHVRRLLSPPRRLHALRLAIIRRALDVHGNWLLLWFLTHHPLPLERQISVCVWLHVAWITQPAWLSVCLC